MTSPELDARLDAMVVVRTDAAGTRIWRLPTGGRHRSNGPAIEHADGGREWYRNCLPHRLEGPAVDMADGRQEWWVNGRRHRGDGPALVRPAGGNAWYVDGIKLAQADEQELDELWAAGEREVVTHVLALYRLGGPTVGDLVAAVRAARA